MGYPLQSIFLAASSKNFFLSNVFRHSENLIKQASKLKSPQMFLTLMVILMRQVVILVPNNTVDNELLKVFHQLFPPKRPVFIPDCPDLNIELITTIAGEKLAFATHNIILELVKFEPFNLERVIIGLRAFHKIYHELMAQKTEPKSGKHPVSVLPSEFHHTNIKRIMKNSGLRQYEGRLSIVYTTVFTHAETVYKTLLVATKQADQQKNPPSKESIDFLRWALSWLPFISVDFEKFNPSQLIKLLGKFSIYQEEGEIF